MGTLRTILNSAVAAILAIAMGHGPTTADEVTLDQLFESLRNADPSTYEEIERQIWLEWSKSGSSAMDLLLERGRKALEAGDLQAAIEHFTALIDHSPDFAEGYNARATAYFQAGLYGPSLEDIRQTLALNPRHFGAISGLALILEEIGETEGALDAWRAVETMNPARPGVKEAIERLQKEVEGQTL